MVFRRIVTNAFETRATVATEFAIEYEKSSKTTNTDTTLDAPQHVLEYSVFKNEHKRKKVENGMNNSECVTFRFNVKCAHFVVNKQFEQLIFGFHVHFVSEN